MKKTVIIVLLLASASAGCANHHSEVKAEAHDRWRMARARVLYGISEGCLKSRQLARARGKAQEALTLQDGFHDARLLLGRILIEEGKYASALAELNRVAEACPKSAETQFLVGVAQEKNAQPEEALVSYRRAQALRDDNLPAIMACAEVLVDLDRIREAQLQIESYMSVAGDEVGMYELAGRLAMMRGDHAGAAGYYRQACDLDFDNLHYRQMLGKALCRAGQYRRAVEALRDVTTADDYEPTALAYTLLGDCYMALGRTAEARDAYFEATERAPESPGVWSNLGKAALTVGDLPRAILSARQALSLDATWLDASLLLGYALVRDGQLTRAVGVLTQATAAHPGSAMLQCVLGQAHAAAGDADKARQCFARAVKLDPDNPAARELLNSGAVRAISRAD